MEKFSKGVLYKDIMQKAMRNFIEINRRKISLEKVEFEIDKVKKAEIEKARKKQVREWRKEMYYRTGIKC